ncbi:GH39 family glycosyl hydrolase [Croceitalea sp. MTPC5]|uniref:GH39 family glycosyl hydrolase n=1 Tax=Croceitalea sp. MTPC5 TaxID=3056565 RepID=UPI0030D29B24
MRNRCYLLLIVLIFSCAPSEKSTKRAITIDFSQPQKQLVPFWTATGFSPAQMVGQNEMKDVLRDIGELPDKGLGYIRPHYLLNLITVQQLASETPRYDWSRLDAVLDEIVNNDLKMIFELMGTPSNTVDINDYSTDFDNLENPEQIHLWKKFVTDLALHLESRYGKETIRSWYFETTNEPDLDFFWKYDVATFLNYYDACSEGLREADANLRFGGPGTANDLQPVFKELLAHCDSGINFFTGKQGVRLDFISVHMKDDPYDMLKRELTTVGYIRKNHPKFTELPFINDEADPMAGWSRDFWWRRGAWYAAFVAQNIDVHQKKLIDSAKVNYTFQSNDHAFMGGWHARTTHALFYNPKDSTQYRLVPKPVLTVMDKIAELGDTYIDVDIPKDMQRYFGVMATLKGKDSLVLMVYNKTDFDANTHDPEVDMPEPTTAQKELMKRQAVNLKLELRNIPFKAFSLTQYQIDQENTNPYETWVAMGSPKYPSEAQYEALLKKGKPEKIRELTSLKMENSAYATEVDLPSPAVSFLVLEKIKK